MARGTYRLGAVLTKGQTAFGFIWLLLYVFVLPALVSLAVEFFSLPVTDLQANLLLFILNTAAVWAIFHKLLVADLRNIRLWPVVQAIILGIVMYYAATWAVLFVMDKLSLSAEAFNDATVMAMAGENRTATLVIALALAPILEETLFRGLVFGSVHKVNRILAYAATAILFAALHVWQYAPQEGIVPVLLAGIRYLPAGVALAWTYEKAGTIWASVFMHSLLNAIAFGVVSLM